MFERFTDRARRVVVLAQARVLNHDYIGTEHILLGLIHEGEGVAARALESLRVSLNRCASTQPKAWPGATGRVERTPRATHVPQLLAAGAHSR
jgi:ATP-dependent Clp protease ATP-binding subunit ClpC